MSAPPAAAKAKVAGVVQLEAMANMHEGWNFMKEAGAADTGDMMWQHQGTSSLTYRSRRGNPSSCEGNLPSCFRSLPHIPWICLSLKTIWLGEDTAMGGSAFTLSFFLLCSLVGCANGRRMHDPLSTFGPPQKQ